MEIKHKEVYYILLKHIKEPIFWSMQKCDVCLRKLDSRYLSNVPIYLHLDVKTLKILFFFYLKIMILIEVYCTHEGNSKNMCDQI